MNSQTTWSIVALCLAIACFQTRPVTSCIPMVIHPQTTFCAAEFVILIRAGRPKDTGLLSELRYEVDILEIFKGDGILNSTLRSHLDELLTAGPMFSCGPQYLNDGEKYIIFGKATAQNMMKALLVDGVQYIRPRNMQAEKNLLRQYDCSCQVHPHRFSPGGSSRQFLQTRAPSYCTAPSRYSCEFREGACIKENGSCVWRVTNPCKEEERHPLRIKSFLQNRTF